MQAKKGASLFIAREQRSKYKTDLSLSLQRARKLIDQSLQNIELEEPTSNNMKEARELMTDAYTNSIAIEILNRQYFTPSEDE